MDTIVVVKETKTRWSSETTRPYTIKLFFSPLLSMALEHLSSNALGEDQFCGIFQICMGLSVSSGV